MIHRHYSFLTSGAATSGMYITSIPIASQYGAIAATFTEQRLVAHGRTLFTTRFPVKLANIVFSAKVSWNIKHSLVSLRRLLLGR